MRPLYARALATKNELSRSNRSHSMMDKTGLFKQRFLIGAKLAALRLFGRGGE
jgi:hypothetical protein